MEDFFNLDIMHDDSLHIQQYPKHPCVHLEPLALEFRSDILRQLVEQCEGVDILWSAERELGSWSSYALQDASRALTLVIFWKQN